MNENVKDYAEQCAVFKMANQNQKVKKTLSAVAHLQPVDERNERDTSLPLDIFGSFSRIQLTLIEKGNGSLKNPTCNLTVDEINYIAKRTEIAMELMSRPVSTNQTTESPAYIVHFTMGKFKGKTPAEVNNKDELLSQRKFLEDNLGKYPANQNIIDGIDDAVRLIDAGKLDLRKATPSSAFVLYEVGNKTRTSVKDDNGNVLVTGIKIVVDTSRVFPIEVVLDNCYAPLKVDEIGRQNVELSSATNKTIAAVNMTMFDFFTFISNCKRTCDLFADKHAGEAFRLMNKYRWKPDSSKKEEKEEPQKQKTTESASPKPTVEKSQDPISNEETRQFEFFTKGEVITEGDNYTVAVAITGFSHIGKLQIEKPLAEAQSWWKGFCDKAASDGVKNFKVMANRKGGTFTFLSLAK